MPNHQKVAVLALVWADGDLLLLRRSRDFKELATGKGIWDLPGGKLEAGEDLLPALQRELSEETGHLKLPDNPKLETVLSHTVTDGVYSTHRVDILYSFQISERFEPELSEEHDDFQWVGDGSVLEQMNLMKAVKDYLLQLLQPAPSML